MTTTDLIQDGESLVGATQYASEQPIRIWDDGFGPLWVYREACGHFSVVMGIVRAQTWEDAYSCCEDEIMDDADPDDVAEYFKAIEADENTDIPEGLVYRSNGVPSQEGLESAMAQCSLSGQDLSPLTPDLLEELEITLTIESEE